MNKPNYFVGLTEAISQLINALLGGWADEMLSARAYRLHTRNNFWFVVMMTLDFLFFWQDGHCYQCYHWEKYRKSLDPEYRNKEV